MCYFYCIIILICQYLRMSSNEAWKLGHERELKTSFKNLE